MDAIDSHGTARERRGHAVVSKLVGRYRAAGKPHEWLQALTLSAIRTLDTVHALPAEKSKARQDIHAMRREVVNQANALDLRERAMDPGVDRPAMP